MVLQKPIIHRVIKFLWISCCEDHSTGSLKCFLNVGSEYHIQSIYSGTTNVKPQCSSSTLPRLNTRLDNSLCGDTPATSFEACCWSIPEKDLIECNLLEYVYVVCIRNSWWSPNIKSSVVSIKGLYRGTKFWLWFHCI